MALAMTFSMGSVTGPTSLVGGGAENGFIPYVFAAKFVPGLDTVRAPFEILPAAHLALCVLAGLGAAGLLRSVPERAALPVTVGLIAFAAIETMRPAFLGLPVRVRYGSLQMRPDPADVALYTGLTAAGHPGPLLEMPVVPKDLVRGSRELLLTAYHHRRTSSCYNTSRISSEIFELSRRLPGEDALARAHSLGFRAIVLHHERDNAMTRALRSRFERAAAEIDEPKRSGVPQIIEFGETDNITVYRVEP